MKKAAITIGLFVLFLIAAYFLHPGFRSLSNVLLYPKLPLDTTGIAPANRCILQAAERFGPDIAPSYREAVCTEYLIGVLEQCRPLSGATQKGIHIILGEDDRRDSLLRIGDPVMKGVYTALQENGMGIPVDDLRQAKAGDLVQVWYRFGWVTFGHAGILRAMDLEKGIFSLYSSTPRTGGHGVQTYPISPYLYVVRMR